MDVELTSKSVEVKEVVSVCPFAYQNISVMSHTEPSWVPIFLEEVEGKTQVLSVT